MSIANLWKLVDEYHRSLTEADVDYVVEAVVDERGYDLTKPSEREEVEHMRTVLKMRVRDAHAAHGALKAEASTDVLQAFTLKPEAKP